MDNQRFDLYMTGQLAAGGNRDTVTQQLAKLFKVTPEQIAGKLQGKPSRIRKNLPADELERYRAVFDKLGVLTETKACKESPEQNTKTAADSELSLSPQGTPVLRDDEHSSIPVVEPDTSAFSLAEPGASLDTNPRPAAVLEPNTDHLSVSELGEGRLSEEPLVPEVDVDALAGKLEAIAITEPLSPPKKSPPPPPNTDHIQLKD